MIPYMTDVRDQPRQRFRFGMFDFPVRGENVVVGAVRLE